MPQSTNFSRRKFLRNVAVSGLAALLSISGCPVRNDNEIEEPNQPAQPIENNLLGESTTGVEGFNTPEEILANEEIVRIAEIIRTGDYGIMGVTIPGYDVNFQTDIEPPNVEGRYLMSGKQIFPPSMFQFPEHEIELKNQTLDNYITFDEGNIGCGQKSRTIIRGKGEQFSIYDVFKENDGAAEIERVRVLNCSKSKDGNMSGTYLRIAVRSKPENEFPPGSSFALFVELKKVR